MSADSSIAMTKCESKLSYRLYDGNQIDICVESFAPEILFQPQLMGADSDTLSIQEAVKTSALKCDSELREELYQALIPCGGVATLPGFFDRYL